MLLLLHLKRQSEHSGLRPDTSSLVTFYSCAWKILSDLHINWVFVLDFHFLVFDQLTSNAKIMKKKEKLPSYI